MEKNYLNQLWKEIANIKKVNDESEVKFAEWNKDNIEWNKERTELMRKIDNLKKINDEGERD